MGPGKTLSLFLKNKELNRRCWLRGGELQIGGV